LEAARPNWQWICSLEGGDVLTGYVPYAGNSNSGVTIGAGVDLGQIGPADIRGLPGDLQALVQPYLGLKKLAAVEALKKRPLRLTEDQALALDALGRAAVLGPLRRRYDAFAGPGSFAGLPEPAMTVLASVAYQYGGGLADRCPVFWRLMVRRDWPGAVAELEHFGDPYPTRRKAEAAYLSKLLPAS